MTSKSGVLTERHRTVILPWIQHSTSADFLNQATRSLKRQYATEYRSMTPDLRRMSVIELDQMLEQRKHISPAMPGQTTPTTVTVNHHTKANKQTTISTVKPI